ncbi:MAG TPA: hypothetical protein VFY31_09770 [Macromonas sp.]|nr:hypothetical protein [Macromonas sp.]
MWRRAEEFDADGNICLRYFGPRYAVPLTVAFWVGVGLYQHDDPLYQRHPENFYVFFVFAALSVLASIHFVLYRITLKGEIIERVQWPLKPRRYSIEDLRLIGRKGRQTTLQFHGGETLKIQLLLSGQSRFIERMQHLLVAQASRRSQRSHRPKGQR